MTLLLLLLRRLDQPDVPWLRPLLRLTILPLLLLLLPLHLPALFRRVLLRLTSPLPHPLRALRPSSARSLDAPMAVCLPRRVYRPQPWLALQHRGEVHS